MMMNKILTFGLIIPLLAIYGCKKFLEEKSDQRLSTIETITDMQALLNFYNDLNYNEPAMGEICGDNYFISDAVFNQRPDHERNLYVWAAAYVFPEASNSWLYGYKQVNIANTVLQAVKDKETSINDKVRLANIKAQALFFRAKAYFNMVSIWAMPYDRASSTQLPGLPLRLDPDLNKVSTRAGLAETYAQIIQDFTQCLPHLLEKDVIQTRPSKGAAYGMLSRVYLQMREYNQAGKYADSALNIQRTLIDYNKLDANANFPIALLNAEVIFESRTGHTLIQQASTFVSPELYNLYSSNDLRKTIFFRPSGTNYLFRGSYEGAASYFTGISTGELLLTRAECLIRSEQINKGLEDLNQLLINRLRSGSFVPIKGLNKDEALKMIKTERRKELAFRALRWADIRRFNQEGDAIILKRNVNGKEYTLMPNDLRYALAIPEDIIQLSGISQNAR
ncbi:MAG: RagB/SusD family nutrient uptake outer membrane protein [Chryseobacterium sp.]|nr:MAG: RagB/SusD family nutrient uptake outer membrane protein [Chryseobacterium sp.]